MISLGGSGGSKRGEDSSTERFWKDTETKIGEAVLAYGLAQYISGEEDDGPLWGIIYLSETRLFFRHFPQTSWFVSIMANTRTDQIGESERPAKERDIQYEWPLSSFARLQGGEPVVRGWRRLLHGNKITPYTLIRKPLPGLVRDTQREFAPLEFTVEHNRATFIQALERALNSAS